MSDEDEFINNLRKDRKDVKATNKLLSDLEKSLDDSLIDAKELDQSDYANGGVLAVCEELKKQERPVVRPWYGTPSSYRL